MRKDFKDADVKVLHILVYDDGNDYLLDRGDMLFLVDGSYLARKLLKDKQTIDGLSVVNPSKGVPYLHRTKEIPMTEADALGFSPMPRLSGESRHKFYDSDAFKNMYQALLKRYRGGRDIKGIHLEVGDKIPDTVNSLALS